MAITSSASDRRTSVADAFVALQPQMTELDRFLRAQISAFEPQIRGFAEYCLASSGKRLRPALVFFSGWPGNGKTPSADLVRAAAVVEMVHLATLVHDDIMDEAEVRRGRGTASRVYGTSASVLMGDAFFAQALYLAAQFPTVEICALVSESTRRVCAGEIMQTLRRGQIDLTLADYYRIVELKTAELFRISCHLGSRLANYPAEYVESAGEFGRRLGIAYQIYDDLTDFFGDERRIGKTLGTDLASGKLTLPLLLLAERLPPSERSVLLDEIGGKSPPQFPRWLEKMRVHGVFEAVAEAIQAELNLSSAALQPWAAQPPTAWPAQLIELLRAQVRTLASSASSE